MSLLFPLPDVDLPAGASLFRGRLPVDLQMAVLDDVAKVMEHAPPFRPQMPTGPYMINSLTNCGACGWFSDRKGYRYEPAHPQTHEPWPAIPQSIKTIAIEAASDAGFEFEPDACLVNIYAADGRLSLHQDRDEADFRWPIVSLSLGCDADFQLAGLKRTGPSTTFALKSGDVFVFGGESRLRYHGVRRIRSGTSPIRHPALPENGRINLTLRRAS